MCEDARENIANCGSSVCVRMDCVCDGAMCSERGFERRFYGFGEKGLWFSLERLD